MTGAPPDGAEGGRLGVWTLGFGRRPGLWAALSAAGWTPRLAAPGADAVGVWGLRRASWRGRAAARLTGRPVITVEDGFLSGIASGPQAPVVSLLIDDLGAHIDASRPSRLERRILEGGGAGPEAARAAIRRLRKARLTKYNAAPRRAACPSGHVLIADQARGDASVRAGGAGADDFARMLQAARAEHPAAEIIVKPHPAARRGYIAERDLPPCARLWRGEANPWDLIEGARAVYAVTSQIGIEAVLAGVPTRIFGMPWYAGWGVTEDEQPPPARRAPRRTEEIFAAGWLDHPVYVNPWTGALTDFDGAADAVLTLRRAHDLTRQRSLVSGVRRWKRRAVAGFLDGAGGRTIWADGAAASRRAEKVGARLVVWGGAKTTDAWRLEDGFIRSRGLGAALTPPLSLTLDDLGAHYDPRRESRLERLIAAAATGLSAAQLGRAARLRARVVALGVTKYNSDGPPPSWRPPAGRRVMLCAGQVADDASVLCGAGEARTDAALLRAARRAAPDAWIIYRPHPDVRAGLRAASGAEAAAELADAIDADADPAAALDQADEVWTITSLMGFEALLRGRRVICLGQPFYAGWGLTEDRGGAPARRRARPSLDALVHAALIDYPLYRDPVSGMACPPEVVVERLAEGRDGGRTPALSALSALQSFIRTGALARPVG